MEKINKAIGIIKENKWLHYMIIIVVGMIISIPLRKIQISDTHDGFLHMLRILGTDNALKIGEIPPIIVPYFCKRWGICNELILQSTCYIYSTSNKSICTKLCCCTKNIWRLMHNFIRINNV